MKTAETTIVVIPAEGDSVETESLYVKALHKHYGKELNVIVFEPSQNPNVGEGVHEAIRTFWAKNHCLENVEIHAQAGFGCFTAFAMLNSHVQYREIKRVFFIGGAPSNAMTKSAFLFHRYFAWIWYYLPIPYFADDPNPDHSFAADCIRRSSTRVMRANPKLYREQLRLISHWILPEGWESWHDPECYFVPNGVSKRWPQFRDQTYDNKKAIEIWDGASVQATDIPCDHFSMYSLYPFISLFDVMDKVRTLK